MLRFFSCWPSTRVINGRRVFTAELTCFARACSCVRSASSPHTQNPPHALLVQFLVPDPGLVFSTTFWNSKSPAELSAEIIDLHIFWMISKPEHGLKLPPPSITLGFHVLYSLVVIRAEMFPVRVSSGSSVSVNPTEMIFQPLSWNQEQLWPIVLMETAPMVPQSWGKSSWLHHFGEAVNNYSQLWNIFEETLSWFF